MGSLLIDRTANKTDPISALKTFPELVIQLHKDYIEAGAQLIQTCTFSTNRIALERANKQNEFLSLNHQAILCAKTAIDHQPVWLAGNVGSCGLSSSEIVRQYQEVHQSIQNQCQLFYEEGLDLITFETITSLIELEIILDVMDKPVQNDMKFMISVTPSEDLKLFDGTTSEIWTKRLNESRTAAIGINCISSPTILREFVNLSKQFNKPTAIRCNSGIPVLKQDKWIYPVDENSYCVQLEWTGAINANLIGGCCGTTPDHIRNLKKYFGEIHSGTNKNF